MVSSLFALFAAVLGVAAVDAGRGAKH